MDLHLQILEEPSSSFRYRYKSEMHGAHGHIAGDRSQKSNKTLPKVCLFGWDKPAVIRCTLAAEKEDKEHPHLLVMKIKKNEEVCEPHIAYVGAENNWEAEFKVGIIQTAKRDAKKILQEKKVRRRAETGNTCNLTTKEKMKIGKEAADDAQDVDLNAVRLRFEALDNHNNPILDCYGKPLMVFSRPILNKKCAANGELKIIKSSVTAGTCKGNTEVMLFVDKVDKKNIKIRFFEEDDEGKMSWEAYGEFTEGDVHHQYGIVFNTPPYRNQEIENDTEVYFELVRPKDNERSSPVTFFYQPSEECPGKKRKLDYAGEQYTMDIDTELNSVAPRETDSFNRFLFDAIPDNEVTSSNCLNIELVNEISFDEFEEHLPADLRAALNSIHNDDISKDGASRNKKILKRSPTESIKQKIWAAVSRGDIETLNETLENIDQLQKMSGQILLNEFNDLGQSSIHLASASGNKEMLEFLLAYGIDATTAERSGGKTPLHIAARGGKDSCVKLLVREAAASVDARDWKGQTALHYAAGAGLSTICETLLDAESDPDTPNLEGETPLDLAIGKKALEEVFSKYSDKLEERIAQLKIEAE